MNLDKAVEKIGKRLGLVEGSNSNNNDRNPKTEEGQRAEERERYQAMKRKYELHHENRFGRYLPNDKDNLGNHTQYVGKPCISGKCVMECPFWPEEGYLAENGNVFYEDVNLDENFLGTDHALESRKKVAAMSAGQYEKYRQNLKLSHEYTEETKRALEEGKRLYVRSGIYPPYDDPENIPGAQYYVYKFRGDIYNV